MKLLDMYWENIYEVYGEYNRFSQKKCGENEILHKKSDATTKMEIIEPFWK